MSHPMGLGAIGAVLFDKDGTLFDFRAVWTPAYRAAAEAYAVALGRPALAPALLAAAGYDARHDSYAPDCVLISGDTGGICAAFEAASGSPRPDLLAPTEAVLDRWSAREVPPLADLDRLFGDLKARGLGLGIASMDSRAALAAVLRRSPWRRHVDFTCGYDSGHGTKPGPGMVQAFARAVDVPVEAVAVVGDSAHDIAMARAAGAGLAIAVRTGPTPEARLQAADVVLDDITALPDWLAGRKSP